MVRKMYDKAVVKGIIKPLILKLLFEHRKMYGAEITRTVKEMSGGKLILKEGALYPALHQLLADEVLRVETKRIGITERKYYLISEENEDIAKARVNEMKASITLVMKMFGMK